MTTYLAYGFCLGDLTAIGGRRPQEKIVRDLVGGPHPSWVKYTDLCEELVRRRDLMIQTSFHRETTYYSLVLASTVSSAQKEPLSVRLRPLTAKEEWTLEWVRSELPFLLLPEPSWLLIPSDL